MINFKLANLASIFSKKNSSENNPKKEQDYASINSSEKKHFSQKNLNVASENSNFLKNAISKNSNCSSKSENQQINKSSAKNERNEKAKSTKGYLTNNNLLLGFLPALYLISSVAIIFILLGIRAFNGHYYQNNFLSLGNSTIANANAKGNAKYADTDAIFSTKINTDLSNDKKFKIELNADNSDNNNNNNKKNNNNNKSKNNKKNNINNNNNNINNNNNNAFIKLHKINLTSTTTIKIPNFYDLQKINPTAFTLYITLSCGSSLAISLLLHAVLKQRFKVPEFQAHAYKLNIMLLFSLGSNSLHLARAAAPPLFERYFRLGEEFQPELENEFKQMLFLLHIFFSILLALYSILIVNLIRQRSCPENNDAISKSGFFPQVQSEMQQNKWFLYKYITLFYLCFLTLLYVLVLLQDAGIVAFGPFADCLKDYKQPVTAMFPYFIHVVNSVLVFTFFFELKFVNMTLAQNIDVDYLFEEEEEENKDCCY